MRKILCGLALGLVIFGSCANKTYANVIISTGIETTIKASMNDIKVALVDIMAENGYQIRRQTKKMIQFDKPMNSIMDALLNPRAAPNLRVTYILNKADDGIRVIADIHLVENPGSSHEIKTDENNSSATPKIQSRLDAVKAKLEESSQ